MLHTLFDEVAGEPSTLNVRNDFTMRVVWLQRFDVSAHFGFDGDGE